MSVLLNVTEGTPGLSNEFTTFMSVRLVIASLQYSLPPDPFLPPSTPVWPFAAH
jgi:hypothetical protein